MAQAIATKKKKTGSDPTHAFLEANFNYWFSDHAHVRSPFPEYMRDELKETTTARFLEWAESVSQDARKGVNEEILVEKLEEILFEAGLALAKTEDEKITIRYPFMPRLGDPIDVKGVSENSESKVIEREVIKRDKKGFLKITMQNETLGDTWKTEFELPD